MGPWGKVSPGPIIVGVVLNPVTPDTRPIGVESSLIFWKFCGSQFISQHTPSEIFSTNATPESSTPPSQSPPTSGGSRVFRMAWGSMTPSLDRSTFLRPGSGKKTDGEGVHCATVQNPHVRYGGSLMKDRRCGRGIGAMSMSKLKRYIGHTSHARLQGKGARFESTNSGSVNADSRVYHPSIARNHSSR